MLPIDDRSSLLVVSRLRGLALIVHEGEPPRTLLSSGLCLVVAAGDPASDVTGDANGDRGALAPGRQPFARLGRDQLLARAPTQVIPFLHGDRCCVLVVDTELVAQLGHDPHRLPRFHSLSFHDRALADLARALAQAIQDERDAESLRLALRPLVVPVVERFASGHSRLAPLTPAVARARELLHQRFADELPLEAIARRVAMSKCHLVHLFHKELGLPPHAYQIQLRIAHARRLVASGTPLAEVATLTGFADQSHLTRLFKRIVGVPPGRYAARTQRVVPVENHLAAG